MRFKGSCWRTLFRAPLKDAYESAGSAGTRAPARLGNASHRLSSRRRRIGDFPGQNGLVRELGYTRVSTSSQDAQLQLDALAAAGVQKRDVFADVTSGSKTAIERPGMKKLLEYAEEGDTVVVQGSTAWAGH